MQNNFWVKLYIEDLNDIDVCTLSDRLWRRRAELILLAGKLDARAEDESNRGLLPETRKIAFTLRLSPAELETDLNDLAAAGFITRSGNGWLLPNYAAQQAPISAKERQAAKRRREQERERESGKVTPRDEKSGKIVTARDTDTDIHTYSNSETDSNTETDNIGGGAAKNSNGNDDDVFLDEILALDSRIDKTGAKAVIKHHQGNLPALKVYLNAIKGNIPPEFGPGLIINALKELKPFTGKIQERKPGGGTSLTGEALEAYKMHMAEMNRQGTSG